MSILVKHDVVRLQISKDNVFFVQVLHRQQDLTKVEASPIFLETSIFLQTSGHVATRSIVEKQEQLFRSLECVLEPDDKWMRSVGEYVTLRLRVLDEVLAEDLFFVQDFHRVELA